jgi:L-rhamnose mutarotase
MQRVGFTFKIRPELKDNYKKAHDEIWPEMAKALRDVGIKNYSIYFKKDGVIFAYLESDNFNLSMEKISKMDVNIRWQKYMEKYFIKENKSIIGPEIDLIEEVFHLD